MNEYSYSERHMGTTVSLSFICTDKRQADAMAGYCMSVIQEYEERFSRFLPESELSELNRTGTGPVSAVFMAVLERSLELATLTNGGFNPLIQVKTLGYDRPYTTLETATPAPEKGTPIYSTDLALCQIDTDKNHVTLGPQQQLDFGGILKGYLAATLADTVMNTHSTCSGCIINIGGDIATRGYDELHQPFIFYLYNPVTGSELPIALTNQSLATSGTYARTWHTSAGTRHHIVDGKTRNNPTTDLVAVSIITNDGALTEALTKLFLTRGEVVALATVPPDQFLYQYCTFSKDGTTHSTIPTL